MIVCAVFEVEEELVLDAHGEFYRLPVQKRIGYAVFENGVMISPKIYPTYAEAEAWMQAELEARESQSPSSPGMGM